LNEVKPNIFENNIQLKINVIMPDARSDYVWFRVALPGLPAYFPCLLPIDNRDGASLAQVWRKFLSYFQPV
jgi:hypothetical protein